MSALGHFLESAGIATAGISLVRENTELMRPPRALWVPFELGRPFGAPHAPDFQMRVLKSALALLDRTDGPVILEDFPDDAPDSNSAASLVCPVNFPKPPNPDESDLLRAVLAETASLAPWHALFMETHGRSIATVSGLDIDAAARYAAAFLDPTENPEPPEGKDPASTLRFAIEDLRNWRLEAITAQPGPKPSSKTLADWFWGETATGALALALHPVLLESASPRLRQVGAGQLVPRAQRHRLG
ncbi:hypothetical protein OAN80_00745 [Alphaproteobacteria bacterium]|nr:hypothetical protein [Alphaproteobacteria bacterium]